MQNQCAEIKTRAGEILKEQEKHEGVRPAPETGNRVSVFRQRVGSALIHIFFIKSPVPNH